MTESTDGIWRDERKLPLSELTQAMAIYSQDGQVDDLTGEDAGAEQEYGHGPEPEEHDAAEEAVQHPPGDPDPTSEAGRRLRPSPDGAASPFGRTGPN
ncbi:hypothetical protein COUCH_26515 [Couchioplanes caeruleus]|uniref:hypothetical protein n=1 Tax=Couchioplanes caeruleus TaxID=56438 RepID=UPI0020BF2D5B|nr:hypothetical protein [Couchioplanes caeruleus]UQU62570.1 hypothetical protein COUCH_26515 [Couchioplanes caeruleus]